jgi:hypothetical protein
MVTAGADVINHCQPRGEEKNRNLVKAKVGRVQPNQLGGFIYMRR